MISNVQTNCRLELSFRKAGQCAGGQWVIHSTKQPVDSPNASLQITLIRIAIFYQEEELWQQRLKQKHERTYHVQTTIDLTNSYTV